MGQGIRAAVLRPTPGSAHTDTAPPVVPAGLTATAAGPAAINLSWTASIDNVGVTAYIVRRNGVQVGTSLTTSYTDTGLTDATAYTYTVAARDASGNVSADSTSASATTADDTPPSTPTGLAATAAGTVEISLTWNASTDNVDVANYIVSRNGVQLASTTTSSFTDAGLAPATTYSYTVAARDASGNVSPASTSASATTGSPADTSPPSTPTGVVATAAGATTINLSWSAATDNVAVTGYAVKRNGLQVGTSTTTSFADTGLASGLTYSYTVAARDAAGNVSGISVIASAMTVDIIAPTAPASLTATAAGAATVNLTWTAASDNVGVTSYVVKRNGTQLATTTTSSYADTGLTSATTYIYTVAARDAAGNVSANSASASATTADSIAPTIPTALIATAAGATAVNLTWTASTDNVGVTGYIVSRNGVTVGTTTATSFADSGLSSATTYSYTVAAGDAAGNVSVNSAVVSVTTADVTPPSAPTGVVATAAGATTINLTWIASTDNVGVTGYSRQAQRRPGGNVHYNELCRCWPDVRTDIQLHGAGPRPGG